MIARKILLLTVAVMLVASPVLFVPCGDCAEADQGASIAKAASADTQGNPKGDPLRKLGRGLSNCLTFPIEIPNQISKTNDSDGPMAALTYGAVKGIVMGIFRLGVGAYEVVTFPLPFPEWYKPILTDPEFMFENIDL
jgi:putative exosortase-associated protein (TIGR04073 family)